MDARLSAISLAESHAVIRFRKVSKPAVITSQGPKYLEIRQNRKHEAPLINPDRQVETKEKANESRSKQ